MQSAPDGEPVADDQTEGYKISHALIEAARPAATAKTASFKKDVRYYFGLDHWPTSGGWSKSIPDAWKCKGVRNYLFATIDRKLSVVLGAEPRLRAEPLDSSSTMEQREIAANAVKHELERCRWHELREDLYLTGSIAGHALALLRMEADPFTGEKRLAIDCMDITRFYPDPSATRLAKCQYVCYEPELDLSQIRDLCEALGCSEKFAGIQPKKSDPIGTATPSEYRTRTMDEIIRAPGNDMALDEKNNLRARKANVQFVWIVDESLSTEIKKVVLEDGSEGLVCLDCGETFPPADMCPGCGSMNLGLEQEVTERQYPYGRLIVTCQDKLFYDGPNPDEIDCVFPIAAYIHYRDPLAFQGFGDVAALKSNQMQADKTISQAIDATRLTLMGYLQVPAGEPAWQNVTNEPGQKVPTRPENANITRWITPQGFNPQIFAMLDQTIYSDFQRISGETDIAVSAAQSAPDSATQVNSRDSVTRTRTSRTVRNFNGGCCSDIASIAWQMMVQHYVGPRPFMFSPNGSQFESVVLDVSMLPRNLRIRVEADLDSLEKDKLASQNLVMAMQSGVIPMMPDLLLRAMGIPESVIREVMNRPEMMIHMQQMQLAAAMASQGAMPPGNPPQQPGASGQASQQQYIGGEN